MTTVLALAALNAENFESGSAEAGQVLTADGSGGGCGRSEPERVANGRVIWPVEQEVHRPDWASSQGRLVE